MKLYKLMSLPCLLVGMLLISPLHPMASDNEQAFLEKFKYRYISKDQVKTSKGKIFSNKFRFIEYNDEFDYDFTVLEKPNKEKLHMIGGPNFSLGLKKGDLVMVEWQLTTLYEAAEGNAPYYDWELVTIKKTSH